MEKQFQCFIMIKLLIKGKSVEGTNWDSIFFEFTFVKMLEVLESIKSVRNKDFWIQFHNYRTTSPVSNKRLNYIIDIVAAVRLHYDKPFGNDKLFN